MRKPLILLLLLVAACSDVATDVQPRAQTEAVCPGGAPAFDVYVEPRLEAIGAQGNDIAIGDEALWVVESGANTVSRFDDGAETMERGFVSVGNDRNPYAAAVDDEAGEVWVVNYISATVTVGDTQSGEVLVEIDDEVFDNPSAVALSDNYAYVSDVDYLSPSEGYGPGSVVVIERESKQVVASLDVAYKNPQFLEIADVDGAKALFVSSAGAIEFTSDGVQVGSEGGLEWFDLSVDPVEPPSTAFSLGQLEVKDVGAPGRPLLSPDGEKLYFVSAIAPVVFAFDLQQLRWIYDAADPLVLYEADGDTTHRGANGANGLLWVTAFNDDELYLVDTACGEIAGEAIDLGEVADMLEGPQAVAVVDEDGGTEAGAEGYFLLSHANSLGRVRLAPTGDQL